MRALKTGAVLLVVGLMIWARVFKGEPLEDISWIAGAGPAAKIALGGAAVAAFALAVWALRTFLRKRRPRDDDRD